MTKQETMICNKVGLHARPASQLIKAAKRFQAKVFVEKEGARCELNSILNLLQMQIHMGDRVTVSADGTDECEAVTYIISLIESRFGEN